MSGSKDDPTIGQHPYTDPPPIEQRKFHEDPRPPGDALFTQVMQGRGAPAPRPGHEYEQQAVARPEDTPSVTEVSPNMTVAELLLLPPEEAKAAIDSLTAQTSALAEQRQQLADELMPPEREEPPKPEPER